MRESAESIMYLLVSYKANGTMKIVMDYAVEHCEGRRYALPEGFG